ncbi:MAG: EAL domain-containing protein [Gammaproteobacteria bacterium]|nr:EAL domain-containing protein [Gammaproteobacteria bacterium]
MTAASEQPDIPVLNALDLLNTPVWIWDHDAERMIWGNPSCLELWGADSLEHFLAMDFTKQALSVQFRAIAERFRAGEIIEEEQSFQIEGTPTTVTCQCQGIAIPGCEFATLVEVRQIARSPLDANTQSSIEALQHTPAMVSIHQLDGCCVMRNPAAMRSFGYLEPGDKSTIYDRLLDPIVINDMQNTLEQGEAFSAELLTKTIQGDRWHHFDARIIYNENNNRVILVNELDIHKRKMAADQAHRLAYYDSLTDLPNRVAFSNRIDDILLGLANTHELSAVVIFININNFSDVNSTFGFSVGDEILREVGQRLSSNLHEVEIVARLGGDKFAVLHKIETEANYLQSFIQQVLALFDVPFNILGYSYLLGVRLGIALVPEHAQSENEASRVCDIALNHAKNKGRTSWVMYNHRMSIATYEKTQRVQQLYEAMAKGHFTLYFQPQLELLTGKLVGAETLLRWQQEDGSFVSPSEFIPLAEQMGVIKDITRWVVREACRLNQHWADKGLGPLRIAVNISGAEFADDSFVDVIKAALLNSGLAPHLLELEVTETALVDNTEKAIEVLGKLKELGVEIAIDDFGTGHSSLNYLQHFPVDRLKIDRSFINHVHTEKADLAIVRTILNLAEALDISTIAEGIEYQSQSDVLQQHHCAEGQGYFFSRPLPIAEFEAFLRNAMNGKDTPRQT